MYYFTPETIAQANKNIENLDPKVGGLLCVLHCLAENIGENISYTIDGEQLRRQLSFVFDKEYKDSFEAVKPSYIIFAKNWVSTFFDNYIKTKIDLLSCAVFFLRRHKFDKEHTAEDIIDIFVNHFNLMNYQDQWFKNCNTVNLEYNKRPAEENQTDFYIKMNYSTDFKSILFNSVIKKSAADLKAAGQIQTLYTGSIIRKCLLLSDEPLDKYYIFRSESYNKTICEIESISEKEQKEKFRIWMNSISKEDGTPYSQNTITTYISQMEKGYSEFEKFKEYESPFQIFDINELKTYTDYLFSAEGFKEFNDRAGNRACEYGFLKYRDFLNQQAYKHRELCFESHIDCDLPRNRILFGAPGTGKSHTLNKETDELIKSMNGEYERVTFHPDYSYANFVGTYKPVPSADGITYKYVPGPFMRVLKKALENANNPNATPRPFVLVIEEINRANVAAVFGDVFQLLDRNGRNISDYSIQASEDLKSHLAEVLGGNPESYAELRIPSNMFIWATMNSADQGVFPMDTAFKRRWDFTYLGIDNGDENIAGKTVMLGKGDYKRVVEWNKLRKAINSVLSSKDFKINEDKLMGPYFLSTKVIPLDGEIDAKRFTDAFKSKVIMYLFEDAAKQKKHTLFSGCSDTTRYSSIRDEFDTKGVFIFCDEIHNKFPASESGEGETE